MTVAKPTVATPPAPAAAPVAAPAPATLLGAEPKAKEGEVAPVAPVVAPVAGEPVKVDPAAPAKKEEPAPAAAPIELKLPEGVKADEGVLTKFKEVAGKVGLKSEGAQQLLELYTGLQKEAETKAVADAETAFKAQLDTWTKAVKADKDLGGANFDGTLKAAQKAVTKFDSSGELRQIFEVTGLGSHPAVVRAFAAIGKALAEDSVAGGGSSGGAVKKDLADTMFSNTPQKLRSKRG